MGGRQRRSPRGIKQRKRRRGGRASTRKTNAAEEGTAFKDDSNIKMVPENGRGGGERIQEGTRDRKMDGGEVVRSNVD